VSVAYFEIQADDPAAAVDFYSSVFGWTFARDPHLPIEYWRITSDGVRGAILKRPAPVPPLGGGTNAFVCSFEVKDFDATSAAIERLGGLVALPKFAIPAKCWQGYFVDPAHNTFGIFQVDPHAK
jgi:hypothetical protein